MTNHEIAAVFEQIADLLEFQGSNPFRLRAYRNAGRTFKDLPESVADIVADPDRSLTDIDGIGPVYAGKLYEAGITTFRQLAEMAPDELDELIGAPEWRARSMDTASWIAQAEELASQREKDETT